MRARVIAAAFALLGFGLAASSAVAGIAGIAVDSTGGAPLVGVSIALEASGTRKAAPAPTAADGKFDIDLASLFSASELATSGLTLAFEKDDYRTVTRVVRARERGKFEVISGSDRKSVV